MEKSKTCFFTGDRILPEEKTQWVKIHLNKEIERRIDQGTVNFISGGENGFDQIAASMIVVKKRNGFNIRLILVLPCRNRNIYRNEFQREVHRILMEESDQRIYISDEYTSDCIEMRNRFMADNSCCCICACMDEKSAASKAMSYAEKKGLKIVNTMPN